MPIVLRTLTKLANREDIGPGVKRWRVDGVDGRGDGWVHGPFSGTQAEAETIRDAAWTTVQLQDHEEQKGFDFIEAGGNVEDYAREDLTLNEWRRRVARRWWNTRIEGASDRELRFLCAVAVYIAGFTATQIAAVLGISEAKAQKGLDRAADLASDVCPAIFASDTEQEDV